MLVQYFLVTYLFTGYK